MSLKGQRPRIDVIFDIRVFCQFDNILSEVGMVFGCLEFADHESKTYSISHVFRVESGSPRK